LVANLAERLRASLCFLADAFGPGFRGLSVVALASWKPKLLSKQLFVVFGSSQLETGLDIFRFEMKRFERARREEQKEVRRSAILAAARKLATERGPMTLRLNELGRRSRVSKPNIYRYFESREDVLISIFLDEVSEMVGQLEMLMPQTEGNLSDVAMLLTDMYLARPVMCQLQSMLSPVLEHNLSFERLCAVKRDTCQLTLRAAAALEKALPWLGKDAAWTVQAVSFQVAALWPAAHPSQTAAKVFALPEFAPFKPDAEVVLRQFIETMLSGLLARKEHDAPDA
jgi:TetR/AcrR family transcriptional regulator